MMRAWSVARLHQLSEIDIDGLSDVLVDCVDGGASVSFMHPLSRAAAAQFWRTIGSAVVDGERVVLVARDAVGICGTVQLVLAQPENQPHRADLNKLLVHRRARRRGIGAALIRAAEDSARACGRSLLVLDTASAEADRLYARQGWQRVGVIPDFALLPYGGLCDTTIFYRALVPIATTDATEPAVVLHDVAPAHPSHV